MGVLVLVMGTLKRRQRNHAHMEGARYIREAYTQAANFTLREFDSKSWPGRVTPSVIEGKGKHRIAGELYEVNDEMLRRLDKFEQRGRYYKRITVKLMDGKLAQMYVHMPHSGKKPRARPRFISYSNRERASWSETFPQAIPS